MRKALVVGIDNYCLVAYFSTKQVSQNLTLTDFYLRSVDYQSSSPSTQLPGLRKVGQLC